MLAVTEPVKQRGAWTNSAAQQLERLLTPPPRQSFARHIRSAPPKHLAASQCAEAACSAVVQACGHPGHVLATECLDHLRRELVVRDVAVACPFHRAPLVISDPPHPNESTVPTSVSARLWM